MRPTRHSTLKHDIGSALSVRSISQRNNSNRRNSSNQHNLDR